MNIELLYKNNIKRKRQIIDNIDGNFILKTNFLNYWEKYKIKIIISIVILLILLIISFHNSPSALLSSLTLFIFLIICFIYFNSFSMIGKENKITFKISNEKFELDYKNITNIYLEQYIYKIFLKKYKKYNLIILYENLNNYICDIKLPIILLKEEDIQKLFKKIKTKETDIDYKSKCNSYKRKQLFKKIIIYFIFTIIILIMYLINYFSL